MKNKISSAGGAILIFWLTSNCLWGGTPGSLDPTFNPATRSSDVLWGLVIQPDGKILAGGRQNVTAPIYGVIYRLNTNGQADPGFQSGTRATGLEGAIPQINTIGLQASGSIVLGGQFTYFDGAIRGRLAQLTASGGLDPNFTPAANNHVFSMWIQPDGKILIGGSFKDFKGTGQNYVARLNADGTSDDTFNSGASPDGAVRAIAQQPDGKILIGGDFLNIDTNSRPYIARLDQNGSLDATFSPAASLDASVSAIAVQPADQRIVIGGAFRNAAGESHDRIARLNADGTVDSSFASSCDSTVWALAVQSNGKILAGGRFNNANGTPRKKVVRFLSNGLVDSQFDAEAGSGTGSSDEVRAIQIQPSDGNIVVAGKFTVFNGVNRYGIARLYGDAPVANESPTIIQSPLSLTTNVGASVTFSIIANGTPPLYYQWRKDGSILEGATDSNYVISNVWFTNAGDYTVVVTNGYGAITSPTATLVVEPRLSFASEPHMGPNNQFGFTVQSQIGRRVMIQTTTNLPSTNLPIWTDLTNSPDAAGIITILETTTNFNRRFYRAVFYP